MRPGVFLTCLVTFILACRFYSSPSSEPTGTVEPSQESTAEQDSQPMPLAERTRSLKQQSSNRIHVLKMPGSIVDSPQRKMAVPNAASTRSVSFAKTANGPSRELSVGSVGFHGNALKVQRLVRVQYEIPKAAAQQIMRLKPNVLFEAIEIECHSPGKTILQVTTDERTQKSFSSFLSALFPSPADGFREPSDEQIDTQSPSNLFSVESPDVAYRCESS